MRQYILTAIIVSLWVVFLPIVSAAHMVTVTNNGGGIVATQSNPLSICPRPLTPQDLLMTVKNTGTIVDTYDVDINLPAGWELGEIRSGFSIAPGYTAEVNPFLISYIPSNTLPGVYEIDVTITSSNNPSDKITKTLYIEILACHDVYISITDDMRTVCKEDAIEETFLLTFTNDGKYNEVLELTTSEGWAATIDTLSINKGETKTVDVILVPPEGLTGKQSVVVRAESQTSYVDVSETLSLDIQSCFGVDAYVTPGTKSLCAGEAADFELVLKNSGNADTYTITAPEWVDIPVETIELGENEEKKIGFTATPTSIGVSTFDIQIDSSHSSTVTSGIVNTEECRDVTVFLFPDEKLICAGETVDYTISIKNTGKIAETFEITTTEGTPEETSVEIPAGQTRMIDFFVDTKGMTGEMMIGVKAKATGNDISDQASSTLILEDCYAAEVDILESSQEICPYFETSYTVYVKNIGKKADNYNLKIDTHTEIFSLAPGETKNIVVPMFANVDSGDYEITADLKSPHIDESDSASLIVKTIDKCFSSEVVRASSGAIVVQENRGSVVPVKIKNTGDQGNTYEITSDGPDWIYLRPTSLDLEPADGKNVYLYLLPPFGTPAGEYEIVLTAESEQTSSSLTLMVEVISETEELVSSLPEEPEEIPEETPEEPEETPEETPDLMLPIIDLETNNEETYLFEETEQVKLLYDTQEHMVTVEAASADAVSILIESEPMVLDLSSGDSKEIDIDGDGVNDVIVTYNGYMDGKADITYERVVPIEIPEETEETPEEEIVLEVNDSENDTITLNSSLGTEEDELTGGVVVDTPFWKTAIVGVITLIIIVILLIRFSYLLRSDKKEEPVEEKKETKEKKNNNKK